MSQFCFSVASWNASFPCMAFSFHFLYYFSQYPWTVSLDRQILHDGLKVLSSLLWKLAGAFSVVMDLSQGLSPRRTCVRDGLQRGCAWDWWGLQASDSVVEVITWILYHGVFPFLICFLTNWNCYVISCHSCCRFYENLFPVWAFEDGMLLLQAEKSDFQHASVYFNCCMFSLHKTPTLQCLTLEAKHSSNIMLCL